MYDICNRSADMETDTDETHRLQDERLVALQRVLASHSFSRSEVIRRILKYIIESSVAGHAKDLKEYTIAIDALNCPNNFDPKADNKVRVQMQRLRKKLDEYYSEEGAHDPVRILIPVGHYIPQFERCSDRESESPDDDKASPPATTRVLFRSGISPFLYRFNGLVLIFAILIVAVAMSIFLLPMARMRSAAQKKALSDSLACLWNPFVSSPQPPLIIYSNAFFLMDKQGDLYRYFVSGVQPLPLGAKALSTAGLERTGPMPRGVGPLYYFDAYTGTGEVVAAAKVSQLLAREHENFNIERDGIASYSDIRGSNVIFLGASLEDSVLRTLPVKADLVFKETTQPQFVGSLEILDRHPGPSHPAIYKLQRNPKTGAIQGGYALISLLPGVVPDRYIMILAGISTVGTEAAAEFATSKDSMETLSKIVNHPSSEARGTTYFQALLHVQIRDGECAKTTCLLVRRLTS